MRFFLKSGASQTLSRVLTVLVSNPYSLLRTRHRRVCFVGDRGWVSLVLVGVGGVV